METEVTYSVVLEVELAVVPTKTAEVILLPVFPATSAPDDTDVTVKVVLAGPRVPAMAFVVATMVQLARPGPVTVLPTARLPELACDTMRVTEAVVDDGDDAMNTFFVVAETTMLEMKSPDAAVTESAFEGTELVGATTVATTLTPDRASQK